MRHGSPQTEVSLYGVGRDGTKPETTIGKGLSDFRKFDPPRLQNMETCFELVV